MVNSSVHVEELYKFDQEKIIKRENYYQVNFKNKTSVSLENITFKYINSDDYLFENITLDFPKNKHTIITSPNGSGKYSVRYYLRNSISRKGTIQLSSDSIGYVGVTPLIVAGTLRDNLVYGSSFDYKMKSLSN